MFQIKFNERCKKNLNKLPKEQCVRILRKIKELSENQVPKDAKRIVNAKGKIVKIRIGGYRVLYVINNEDELVIIVNIDKRSKVYQ